MDEKTTIKFDDLPSTDIAPNSDGRIGHNDSAACSIKSLRRTPSAATQAIIAYRTLSITVSENQQSKDKQKPKKKKDLAEGEQIFWI